MPKVLSAAQLEAYRRDGFHFPQRVFTAEEGYLLLDPKLTTGAALAAHTKAEIERWKKVIADAKIPVN